MISVRNTNHVNSETHKLVWWVRLPSITCYRISSSISATVKHIKRSRYKKIFRNLFHHLKWDIDQSFSKVNLNFCLFKISKIIRFLFTSLNYLYHLIFLTLMTFFINSVSKVVGTIFSFFYIFFFLLLLLHNSVTDVEKRFYRSRRAVKWEKKKFMILFFAWKRCSFHIHKYFKIHTYSYVKKKEKRGINFDANSNVITNNIKAKKKRNLTA